MPLVSVVVSSVHSAGAVAEANRTCPLSRNSTRVTAPTTVARNVTSPANGDEPESGLTLTTGPVVAPAVVAAKSSKATVPE